MKTRTVPVDHIYEALTLYLRSLSVINDNEQVVGYTDAMKGDDVYGMNIKIERNYK